MKWGTMVTNRSGPPRWDPVACWWFVHANVHTNVKVWFVPRWTQYWMSATVALVGLVLRGLAHWELQLYGRLSIPPPHVQPLRQGRLTTVYAATSAGADEAAALVSGSRTRSARMVLVHERPVRAPLVGASTWMHLHAVGSVLVFMVHSIPLGPDGVDLQYSW